jgi:hypothetical protein
MVDTYWRAVNQRAWIIGLHVNIIIIIEFDHRCREVWFFSMPQTPAHSPVESSGLIPSIWSASEGLVFGSISLSRENLLFGDYKSDHGEQYLLESPLTVI